MSTLNMLSIFIKSNLSQREKLKIPHLSRFIQIQVKVRKFIHAIRIPILDPKFPHPLKQMRAGRAGKVQAGVGGFGIPKPFG